MKKTKENKAITLIALVITIVVLLILAAITIGQLQNSGLFNKTQVAKETYTIEAEKEQLEIEIANLKMQMYVNNTGSTISLQELKSYLESSKFEGEYSVELFYEPMATTEEVQTEPVYAKVTHIPTKFVFYVDEKLVVVRGESNTEVASDRDTVTIPKEEYDMLKNANTYSEKEQIVGKWFDGRPVYRYCYRFTKTTAGETEVTFSSMGLKDYIYFDEIVKSEIRATSSINNFISNENYFTDKDYYGHYIRQGKTSVVFRSGTEWPKLPTEFIFIIDYTKTTDLQSTPE